MNQFTARLVRRTFLATVSLLLAVPGNAISVNGLQPLVPLTLHKVAASVRDQRLEVIYPDGRLSIHPWPSFLPRHLSDQMIQAERQVWPSGPSERVAFTGAGEYQPWMIIGAHSPTSTPVLDGWQLVHDAGRWYVSDGVQRIRLAEKNRKSRPACIAHEGKQWQLFLLPDPIPSTASSIARELEPRISWLALRQ